MAIKTWFAEHKKDTSDQLSHNKTWNIMRDNLRIMGYWKNKARGKPDIKYIKNSTQTTGSEYSSMVLVDGYDNHEHDQ